MVWKEKTLAVLLVSWVISGFGLYSFYLVAPDMMLTSNWFLNKYHPSWTLYFILTCSGLSLFSIGYLLSEKYLKFLFAKTDIFQHFKTQSFLKKLKLIISSLIIGGFYSQILISFYSFINNYLLGIYLSGRITFLYQFADTYVEDYKIGHKGLQPFVFILLIVIGYFLHFCELRQLNKNTMLFIANPKPD